mmetsp:Transcript_48984/g.141958  ORF Transcript_48984/g.141958 Transcript_48984/m.141958 type:complete len:205 (-) Transcript_48984:866-1480(-)
MPISCACRVQLACLPPGDSVALRSGTSGRCQGRSACLGPRSSSAGHVPVRVVGQALGCRCRWDRIDEFHSLDAADRVAHRRRQVYACGRAVAAGLGLARGIRCACQRAALRRRICNLCCPALAASPGHHGSDLALPGECSPTCTAVLPRDRWRCRGQRHTGHCRRCCRTLQGSHQDARQGAPQLASADYNAEAGERAAAEADYR